MKSNMEKVIRDGKVAVIYSPGYGAGWYTWNTDYPEIIFHPKLVEMIETGRQREITEEWVHSELGIRHVYCGGNDLKIEWLDECTSFDISEYDGYEEVVTMADLPLSA